MKRICLMTMVLLWAGTGFAATVTVGVSKAELRSLPAVGNSKVVKILTLGTPLTVQNKEGRYLQVKDAKGASGWIHNTLVKQQEQPEPAQENSVVINADRANVRLGSGKDHPMIFQAVQGEVFQVLDQSGDWLRIGDASGRSGWIWQGLVAKP
ncbi:MAG: SH3 domain-containing protein [Desulfuromonadaceae bacterium]|jgi:uncharacterized protein YgiM (DUF1202 family)